MADIKTLLGILSVIVALISYGVYIFDIFVRHTKPHAFSWFIWALLAGIAFAAQVSGRAGAGSWVVFADLFLCSLIFLFALRRGEKLYTALDVSSLIAGLLALALWWWTSSPVLSVILITVVDYCAFIATFRKSYAKPHEESVSLFALSACKYTAAFFALDVYSIATAFYIGALVPINAALVAMIVWRRTSGNLSLAYHGKEDRQYDKCK